MVPLDANSTFRLKFNPRVVKCTPLGSIKLTCLSIAQFFFKNGNSYSHFLHSYLTFAFFGRIR